MTSGVYRSKIRRILVVSEVALAVILAIGASLLTRSFYKLQQVSPGFNPENVLMVRFDLPEARYPQTANAAAFYNQLLERLHAMPAVESAAQSVFVPLYNSNSNWGFEIEGRSDEGVRNAYYNLVSEDYFRTLKIPLRSGGFFSKQDQERFDAGVIINETMARRFWPEQNPIGKRINVNLGPPIWREIVGVVGDVKNSNLSNQADSQMYFPLIEVPFASIRSGSLLVRTKSDPLSLINLMKTEIHFMDRNLPLATIQTLEKVVSSSIAQQRFTTALLGLFAFIALVLAAVGIYGVISYSVAQRTHEIGVRMALGARQKQILQLIVGQGAILAAIGLTIGLFTAMLLTRFISSFLFEVNPADPITFALISLLLALVAVIASYLPARKAAKIDPMIALHYE